MAAPHIAPSPAADLTLRAMGTRARIAADGPDPSIAAAVTAAAERLVSLERTWTRFDASSELRRLERSAGAPALVSGDLLHLCRAAREAWHRSEGAVDCLLATRMTALGYDRSFERLSHRSDGLVRFDDDSTSVACRTSDDRRCGSRPGHGAPLDLDESTGLVWLPADTALDPGGIGKGLAADLLTDDLLAAGADWTLVEIGGDLRVAGDRVAHWGTEVEVIDREPIARLVVTGGGVATSTTRKRRWIGPDGSLHHHLLDPRTGLPAVSDLASVTVVAPDAFTAEVEAKTVLLSGRDAGRRRLARQGLTAVLVGPDGDVEVVGPPTDRPGPPPAVAEAAPRRDRRTLGRPEGQDR